MPQERFPNALTMLFGLEKDPLGDGVTKEETHKSLIPFKILNLDAESMHILKTPFLPYNFIPSSP